MDGLIGDEDTVNWIRVASLDEFPPLGARVVRIADDPVAIFRTSDDRLFALRDRCPHKGGPLSQGIVHGSCVTCPLHDWVIDLDSGEATGPDQGATRRYAIRIEGGDVLIAVSRDAQASEYSEVRRGTANETPATHLAAVR